MISIRSVSRILILSGPDFSKAAVFFGGTETDFPDLRDFLRALFIGYYMHFSSYLTNEIGLIPHGTRGVDYALGTWLGDLINEC